MLKGTCIGFLPDAGCGLIYADKFCGDSRVVFVHFRDIQPEDDGWQGLEQGDQVQFIVSEEKGAVFHRACAAVGEMEGGFVQITGESDALVFKSAEELTDFVCEPHQTLVVTGNIPVSWKPDANMFGQDVLFYRCIWRDKAVFKGWQVKGDLVFLGCIFKDAFSLKDAEVSGSVHMEGCDFSGAGGASFRGLKAKALYLDFGIKGPRDMVWLNEMCIAEDVVIGGEFSSNIQVMRQQDNRVTTQTCKDNVSDNRPCFRRLFVGKECYQSQNINRSILAGTLDIHGLCHGEVIEVDHAEIQEIRMVQVTGDAGITCRHTKVLGNVLLEYDQRDEDKKPTLGRLSDVDFQDTYVEGHFTLRYMQLAGVLNLDDATVERVIRLHQLHFAEGGGLQLVRLSANRLVMDDFTLLYGKKKQSLFWQNPRFYMLRREHDKGKNGKAGDTELTQEYVLLKHLLSQEGQLKLEDEAFYHMRKLGHWHHDVGMLFYNYVFGWGVRLQNILASVVMMVLLFFIAYHQVFQFEEMNALQLSIQATFLAFFGSIQPEVMAGSYLSWVVLAQSVMGVIFVTVFVGAYVRKLLR